MGIVGGFPVPIQNALEGGPDGVGKDVLLDFIEDGLLIGLIDLDDFLDTAVHILGEDR